MAENTKRYGLHRADLKNLFGKCAAKAGITMESYREIDIEDVAFSVSQLADDVEVEQKLSGVYRFELQGLDERGQHCKLEIALKAKGSPEETYTPLCELVGKAGPTENEVKHLIPISLNFEHCSDLELMTAQLAMKDEQLGRFLPSIYHTVHDADKEQWAIFMEYLDPNDLAITGGFDMTHWQRDEYMLVLAELAKFHALYIGDLERVTDHFGAIMKLQPRRHLVTPQICRVMLEYSRSHFSQFFTDQHTTIFYNYFDRLEMITEEIESFPMTFVHNDAHIGKYVASVLRSVYY